ncbi:MAG: hypothetical protein JW737_10115 [Acidobacteria bacterium]|nr:hypothetical protein [Acidobacteriota bacterium]
MPSELFCQKNAGGCSRAQDKCSGAGDTPAPTTRTCSAGSHSGGFGSPHPNQFMVQVWRPEPAGEYLIAGISLRRWLCPTSQLPLYLLESVCEKVYHLGQNWRV